LGNRRHALSAVQDAGFGNLVAPVLSDEALRVQGYAVID
jgi:hypothetical protein